MEFTLTGVTAPFVRVLGVTHAFNCLYDVFFSFSDSK